MKTRIKRTLVRTLHGCGAHRLVPGAFAGVGLILMMHRVRPAIRAPFAPNRNLEITPDYLDFVIGRLRSQGLEIVDLDEASRRLRESDFGRRFVVLTFDDGYLDNYEHARPVLERHGAPYTLYLASGLPDGTMVPWWLVLEEVIRRESEVVWWDGTERRRHPTGTLAQKCEAFRTIKAHLRALPGPAHCAVTDRFCADHCVDAVRLDREVGLSWDLVRALVASGLARIEAHTVDHVAASRLEPSDIVAEIQACCARIEAETGRRPRHYAYPFGDPTAAGPREFEVVAGLPLVTATTTCEEPLRASHARRLWALPRVALNGHYQSAAYLDLALSGLPFAPQAWRQPAALPAGATDALPS